jgi:hypothetical protein
VLADCRFADANASVGNEWRSLIFTQCDNNREMRATLYWIAYGIPTIILLIVLIYAVRRAGWLSPREKRQLDANTVEPRGASRKVVLKPPCWAANQWRPV